MNQHRLERLAVELRNGSLAGVVLTLWSWAGELEWWMVAIACALTCLLAICSLIAAILFYADEARRCAQNGWNEARKEYKAGVTAR